MLGRFFAVPLLIIGLIVGGAVAVVLLFGGPSNPPRRSTDELLKMLESGSGERSLGVLLPREKELWQAAGELSERLQKKRTELTAEELDETARRLDRMIRVELDEPATVASFGDDRKAQVRLRSSRLQFLIHALGRTETDIALDAMLRILADRQEPFVADAIQELANLKDHPRARTALEPMTAILTSATRVETLLSACTALSVIASRSDTTVLEALAAVRISREGEVGWSAAIALARLGDSAGRTTLYDLLDRAFWENGERYEKRDEAGAVHRYRMPGSLVDAWMIAAIDASSNLSDGDLWEIIERLQSDPSAAVRGRAAEALRARL